MIPAHTHESNPITGVPPHTIASEIAMGTLTSATANQDLRLGVISLIYVCMSIYYENNKNKSPSEGDFFRCNVGKSKKINNKSKIESCLYLITRS